MQTHFHLLRLSRPIVILVTTLLAALLFSAVGVSAQATDPLSVMKASLDVLNAGNVDTAALADDVVFTIAGRSFRGKEEVSRMIADDVANHVQVEATNFQVAGNKVTYSFKQSSDLFRGLGIEFINGSTEAVIEGGKIKSLTATPTPESAARLQAAFAEPQTMPTTGAPRSPISTMLLALGGLGVLAGVSLWMRRRNSAHGSPQVLK
jgi:hypothetical protein